jgi:hypothetical protein
MTRKGLLLASSILVVALFAASFILNTKPANAAASADTVAHEIDRMPADASTPAASPIDGCEIPVKIKGVKVTPIAGLAGSSKLWVEWEVGELPRCFVIDSFNVTAGMRPNGATKESTANPKTRTAMVNGILRKTTLTVPGKDDGGDCIVTVTARGHAALTGTHQTQGRFWAK